jgi:hypothetical protein
MIWVMTLVKYCIDEDESRCAMNSTLNSNPRSPFKIDLVDSRDIRWPSVVKNIQQHGRLKSLMLEPDGWLSARQNVLVAFDEHNGVVGHAAFHVEMSFDHSHPHSVEARLDDVDVQPGLEGDVELREMLLEEARRLAEMLNCVRLVGFES